MRMGNWGVVPFVVGVVTLLAFRAVPQAKGDAQAGKAVYEEHCLKCHGEKGKGDGATAKKLKMKMADYTNAEMMAKMTDADLTKITASGGESVGKSKLMPAYSDKLNEKQIADVIAYVRALAKKTS